jgi:hypothetical protein
MTTLAAIGFIATLFPCEALKFSGFWQVALALRDQKGGFRSSKETWAKNQNRARPRAGGLRKRAWSAALS